MEPLASVDDVVARWRPLSEAEAVVVETLLSDASNMVRLRWPDIDARIADSAVVADAVVRIVAGMVRRAMLNRGSEGVESGSHTTGPFGDSVKFTNPNNNLFLTADDIRALDPFGGSPRVKMGWLV